MRGGVRDGVPQEVALDEDLPVVGGQSLQGLGGVGERVGGVVVPTPAGAPSGARAVPVV